MKTGKIRYIEQILFCVILFSSAVLNAQQERLEKSHSHNDYLQKHPLTDALKNRFASIEVDVFLVKGELIVSHTHPFFKKQTLEELYLKPLAKIWKERGQEIYRDTPLILLIDIKSDAEKTYPVLKELLKKYAVMFSEWPGGQVRLGAISIILSGNTPTEQIRAESFRHIAFLDQDLLGSKTQKLPGTCMMLSTKYSKLVHWRGRGKMPEKEKQKLTELVREAHHNGFIVRLWASPEKKKVWKELLDCGVDLICTDKITMLSEFLNAEATAPK